MSIDTLKLARRLEEAQMSKGQAEAIAEGIAETLAESTVTKQDLGVAVAEFKRDLGVSVAELRAEIAKGKTEVIFWLFGTVGVGVLLNHFWR